jgi:hypothetical protein
MASTLIFMKIIFQATHHAAAKPPHTPRLIGCSAARLSYWGAEMREFLSDFGNLKRG